MKYRYFTIVDYPDKYQNYGKFKGINPTQCANKAFSYLSKLIDLKNSDNKNLLVFTIKDIYNDKKYKYVGTRVELNEPMTIKKGNNYITYKYKNIITSYKNYIL